MSGLRDPFFLLVISLFLLFALAWGLLLPVHEGPDEQNHYLYMLFLKDKGHLPRQLPLPSDVPGEGHQPPLYYALGAAALRVLEPKAAYVDLPLNPKLSFGRNPAYFVHYADESLLRFWGYARAPHLLRALQLLLPLGSLALAWLSLLLLLPEARGAARTAFALFALNPGFLFFCGVLNNDHAVVLFFSLGCYLILRALDEGRLYPGAAFALGCALGLGALSKQSMLALLPLALWLVAARSSSVKSCAAALLVPALALGGWFFLRSRILYGEWLGWELIQRGGPKLAQHQNLLWDGGWWLFWARLNFESFFSLFGWFSWRAHPAFTLGVLALLMGALAGLRRMRFNGRGAMFLALAAASLLLATGAAGYEMANPPPEGRHYYPLLLPLAAFTAAGFSSFRLFRAQAASWALVLGLACLEIWLLLYRLIPLYYDV